MNTSAVCAALADPERLRVFGTICRQAEGIPVAEAQQAPAGRKALTRLLSYGLVQRAGDRYIVRPDAFLRALRETEGQRAAEAGGGSPGIEGATGQVAALFSRGKLTSMPRPGRLRAELLRWLRAGTHLQRAGHQARARAAVRRSCLAAPLSCRLRLARAGQLRQLLARCSAASLTVRPSCACTPAVLRVPAGWPLAAWFAGCVCGPARASARRSDILRRPVPAPG
jgi:hypothetical protein